MDKKRILVTGFEVVDGGLDNPSGDIASALQLQNMDLRTLLLPKCLVSSKNVLFETVKSYKPDFVLMLGFAQSRKAISIERYAYNEQNAFICDDDILRDGEVMDCKGGTRLECKVDPDKYVCLLKSCSIDAYISEDPGRNVCNTLYYNGLDNLDCPCLLVQLPSYENLDRKTMEKAVKLICYGYFSTSIFLSSCLTGKNCRYDNKGFNLPQIKALGDYYKLVDFCPESELGCPRSCCELNDGMFVDSNGVDHSMIIKASILKAIDIIKENDIHIALLKDKSPSCGVEHIYDGSFTSKVIEGMGMMASRLLEERVFCIAIIC